jgi:hypothetical protein
MVSLDFFIAEPDPTVTAVRKYAVKCPLINNAVYCQNNYLVCLIYPFHPRIVSILSVTQDTPIPPTPHPNPPKSIVQDTQCNHGFSEQQNSQTSSITCKIMFPKAYAFKSDKNYKFRHPPHPSLTPQVKYGVRYPKFILAPCPYVYSTAVPHWLRPRDPYLGSFTRALLVSLDL